jgi:glycosyltransferase involved in cell wall biosynthesis
MNVVLLGTEQLAVTPSRKAAEQKTLVYMGSFMPYKNVDLLVRAMAELPGYRLQLMSRISDDERARLTSLAPEGSIEFFGGASDEQYETALKQATALVSASRDEGFGLPVVEAQALGTPVLLNDIPIFREIGGEPAGYFDGSSVASFVRAVRELENPGEWRRRSAASVEWARRYNWPDAAKQLLQVLIEADAARKAKHGSKKRGRLSPS